MAWSGRRAREECLAEARVPERPIVGRVRSIGGVQLKVPFVFVRGARRSRPRAHGRELVRTPGYVRFYLTYLLCRVSAAVSTPALVLFVLAHTGSVTLASQTTAAAKLSGGLAGPLLGALLDRSRHRRAWIVVDPLGTALVLVLLVTLAHHMPSWVMPVLGGAYGCTTPLTFGGFASSLSEVLAREPAQLVEQASGLEAAGASASFIVGPAAASALSGVFGPDAPMLMLVAAVLALAGLVHGNPKFELPPAHTREVSSVRADLKAGWGAIRHSGALRANMLGTVVVTSGGGALPLVFVLYAGSLHTGSDAIGYLLAAFPAGSLLGSRLLPPVHRIVGPRSRIA